MTVVDAEPVAQAPARSELPPSMVERMTLIMDAFTDRTTRLTLEDVARRTSLPRSTAHRILEQLVRLRWLDHTRSGYGLGRRALGLGGDGAHADIRSAAAGRLHELQIRTGLVVHLAVLDEAEVHYLDKAGGPFAANVPSWVGGRVPAHATALGKAMLAGLEPEEAEARLDSVREHPPARSVAVPPKLHQELNRIRRRQGLAFEYGAYFPGIACVAAPVQGPTGPVAAISLAGEVRAPLDRVAPLVLDAARQVSCDLYPRPEQAAGPGRPDAPSR
ncbi:IclR family transcriptional regulator [Streptomyces sp. NPDC050145]|uniref:IclR family transcriptional regulator n=1 Tax=Streptomyces sp. NPDC050145 TaxID=3365602 RepID=UPI00379272DC